MMFPFTLSDQVKTAFAVGSVLVTLTGGYVSMQKDVHANALAVEANTKLDAEQSAAIVQDHETVARVDERTRIMKEQLDRIEKHVENDRR